jgi:uncharacterized oligopeptide transporter (OPT) family protein
MTEQPPPPEAEAHDAPAPPPPERPSVRSLVTGFVLAIVLCAVNSYLTLSFGVIEEGPTIAALFFFAFFFLSRTKIVPAEMVMVATMGSAGGSLGFISNFFAARVMTGGSYTFVQMAGFAVVTSLVGMAFTIPLREMLVLRENLPWPGSRATSSVIRALVASTDRRQPIVLFSTIGILIAVVVLNDDGGYGFIPAESHLPLLGLAAFGAGIAWSPFAIGGAYLMGLRTGVGFLFGAIVLLAIAPHVPEPAAPHRYVWPGIGFLLASGLMTMAIHWKVIRDSFRSLVARGEGVKDDDPILTPRRFAVFTAIAVLLTAVFSSAFMGLSLLLTVLLVVVAGLIQNVIATRAAAQTAFNPARVMGVLLQGVTALAGGSSAAVNLAGAGFVAGSGAQAGNLTGDLVYGRWLRTPARWQWWAQLVTVVPCSLVSAWVFQQIAENETLALEGEGLPAPVAKIWAAAAQIFEGSAEMPPFAWEALGIGALVGAVYVAIEENEKKIQKWLPSSVGIGIGLVLPVSVDLAFFVGAVLLFVVGERLLKIRPVTLTTIAVGSIVAEGLGGILKPILSLAGLM